MKASRLIPAVLFWAALASAQEGPLIYEGGIVNNASYQRNDAVPGGIVSIFGERLSTEAPTTATALPLPVSLAGVSVQFGDLPGRLFYVSDTQINVQVPGALRGQRAPGSPDPGARSSTVTVLRGDGMEVSQAVRVERVSPGLYTLDSMECGQGVIFNLDANGEFVSVNGAVDSAVSGGFIAIYGTGWGRAPSRYRPADGEPSVTTSPSPTAEDPPNGFFRRVTSVRLGIRGGESVYKNLYYAGKAFGLVGVDQVNMQIPDDAPTGCAIPLSVARPSRVANVAWSQAVTLHVAPEGGSCRDRPQQSVGKLELVEETLGATGESTLTLFAVFEQSKFATLPPTPPSPGRRRCVWSSENLPEGAPCKRFTPRRLDAGFLKFVGPDRHSETVTLGADSQYMTELPGRSLAAGEYRISASGAADVGEFESSVAVGEPISLTSDFPPARGLRWDRPLEVRWTGGDPDSVVMLEITSTILRPRCYSVVKADEGEASIDTIGPACYQQLPVGAPWEDDIEDIEVAVTQFAPIKQVPAGVEVEGLTLGAATRWKRVWRFSNLSRYEPTPEEVEESPPGGNRPCP